MSTNSSVDKVTLYTAPTPNGHPISILLEELDVHYEAISMSISDGDIGKVHNQVKSPWFLEISPNGRIPAIKHESFSVFESSAILLYLTANFDKKNEFGFNPIENRKEYSEVVQWLMFAHGGIGPMQGQAGHFYKFAPEKIPYATERYINEVLRLFTVLETRLSSNEWLAGGKYTIADIKAASWVRVCHFLDINLSKDFPNVKAWIGRIEARPAVQRGLKVPDPNEVKNLVEGLKKSFGTAD